MLVDPKSMFGASPHVLTAMFMLSFIFPDVSVAQSVTPDVVVSASRTSQVRTDALPATTVVTRAQIEASSSPDVVDLLRQQVGVNVRQSGTRGAQVGVAIRGGDAQHTLVLIDGVPLNNLSAGSAALEQIPLALIERIEVVRGNVSALYGSQATGGLIQIFTRQAVTGQVADVTAKLGTKGQRELAAQLSMGNERVQWRVGGAHERVHAISAQNSSLSNPDVDGYRNNSANLSVRVTPNAQTQWGLRWFQTRGRTDIDSVYGPVDGVQFNKNLTQNATAYVHQAWTDDIDSALNVSQITDRYDYTDVVGGSSDTSRYATKNQQVSLENQWRSGAGVWTFGASHLRQRLESSVGFLTEQRSVNSAWVGYQGVYHRHHVQFNGRFDRVSDLKSPNYLTGAVNYGYDVTPAWRVLGGYSNGFAAPSFNQLYYPPYCFDDMCFASSNPNLKPEQANYAHVGVQWVQQGMGARVNYFDTRYRDKIANDANYIPQNIAQARATGAESMAWYEVNDWRVQAGLTYQEVRDRQTDALLIRQPRWTGQLAVGKQWGRWHGQMDWQARSAMADSPSYGGHASGYGVLNVATNYQLNATTKLGLSVGNAFNRAYAPLAGYNAMPRNVLFSLNYRPNW